MIVCRKKARCSPVGAENRVRIVRVVFLGDVLGLGIAVEIQRVKVAVEVESIVFRGIADEAKLLAVG